MYTRVTCHDVDIALRLGDNIIAVKRTMSVEMTVALKIGNPTPNKIIKFLIFFFFFFNKD